MVLFPIDANDTGEWLIGLQQISRLVRPVRLKAKKKSKKMKNFKDRGQRLMALLLAGGVMNVLWIILLALLAFLERVTSTGRLMARLAGIVLVAGGASLTSMGMS
jgi:hypothetical protein